MEHNGFSFYCQREVLETNTSSYVCARYRVGCKARLIARNGHVKAPNDHSCQDEVGPRALTDVRREMKAALQATSLANLSLPPGMVWEQVMSSIRSAYPGTPLHTITRQPAIAIIKYTRSQVAGNDAFRAFESANIWSVAENDPRPFLQFSVVHKIACGQYRFLGFGHSELIRLLRYPGSAIFIDGTFKMVPRPFKQCLIVMVRDPGVDVYVPAVYCLMDSKHQDAYWSAVNYVIIQTGGLLEPATVTCDFEKG